MKKLIGALALVMVLAVGCGASETDFKKAAEDAAVRAAEGANPDFTATAVCEEPTSTDVGTTFDCTVTYNDGDVATAEATIRPDDSIEVIVNPTG